MNYEDIKFIQNDIKENDRKGVTFSREFFDNLVDFVDKQQSEKEKLQKNILKYEDIFVEQQAEIEKLKTEKDEEAENVLIVCDRAKYHYSKLYEEAKEILIKKSKSEAIKEFAEKLKSEYDGFDVNHEIIEYQNLLKAIDYVTKEMVGD